MKVIAATDDEIFVTLTREEFYGITGQPTRANYDSYGGAGVLRTSELTGRLYNLQPMIKSVREVRCAAEARDAILQRLEQLKTSITQAVFPVTEVPSISNTEIKAKAEGRSK